MSRKTSWLRAGVTSVAGLVGLGVSAAVVLGLCLIPFPVHSGQPASVDVVPRAATSARVCPGPLVSVQTRESDATSFVPTQPPGLTLATEGGDSTTTYLAVPDAGSDDPELAPSVVTVTPSPDGKLPLVSGVVWQQAFADDMAGLATAECIEPETESWLVGGATNLGASSILSLSNASASDATVRVEVFGETGRVDSTGSNDVVVPAGSQRLVSLASLAPDLVMPVVHVSSSGGAIVATMQQTLMRSIVPSGIEQVAPGAGPNTSHIIPGVRLVGTDQFADSEGGAVTSDQEPAVRILATTAQASDVVVTTIAADGTTSEVKATVRASTVLQLPFNAVPDGIYTVVVSASTPVVAAVRSVLAPGVDPVASDALRAPTASPTATATPTPTSTTTPSSTPSPLTSTGTSSDDEGSQLPPPSPLTEGSGSGGDFSWYASTTKLTSQTLVSVAQAGYAELTVFNADAASRNVVLTRSGEPDVSKTLEPGRFTVFPVDAESAYTLAFEGDIRASVTYSGVGRSSAVTVRPPSRLGSQILVYPR